MSMDNYRIFSEKTRVNYKGKLSVLTEFDIITIVDGAFSSCGYWLFLHSDKPEWAEMPKGEGIASSEWASHLLLDGKSLHFSDAELSGDIKDPNFEDWTLTLDKLLKGFYLHRSKSGQEEIDDMDGESFDCIIQYALFDEIVFG